MKLTVSLAQIDVIRSDPETNLKKGEALIAEASLGQSDIICFPELWTTGLDWAASERIAALQGETIERISEMAKRYRIWISGSVLELNERGRPSNTHILFDPSGKRAGTYRKTHLFSMLHEDEHMAPGNSLCLVDTPWGLVGLSVCYDIRFPELFRTYAIKGAKIVISPMAFPYPRVNHWKVLVRARAIENQLYMIGVNRVGAEDLGKDGNIAYFGDSVIIDPWGETVIEAKEKEEELVTASIDMDRVDEVRARMNVLKDRRPDLYELK